MSNNTKRKIVGNPHSHYNDAANLILQNTDEEGKSTVFIDPVTIMLICSILSAIFQGLRLYCQIRNGKKAKEQLVKRPLIARIFVTRQCKKVMSKEQYKNNGRQIVNRILKTGREVDEQYIDTLFNGDNNDNNIQ